MVPAQSSQPSPEAANALRLAELAAMPPVRTSRVPAPLAVEGWYMVQLQRLVRAVAAALQAELLPLLAELAAEERQDAADRPVPPRVLRGLDKLKVKARQVAEGYPAAAVVAQAAAKVEVSNATGIGQVARELGLSVQPLQGAPALQAARDRFVAENTALITRIPEDMRERIEQKVRQGVESGKRWETIAQELQDEPGIGERRARLIARDQVNKYNGALTEARMTRLGITHYRWQGAMDARERPTHVALQGLVFAWDKPPPEGHPGHPIQCRCVAIPVVSDREKATAQDLSAAELEARTAEATAKHGGPAKRASRAVTRPAKVQSVPKGGMGPASGAVRKAIRASAKVGVRPRHPIFDLPATRSPAVVKLESDLLMAEKRTLDRIAAGGGKLAVVDGDVVLDRHVAMEAQRSRWHEKEVLKSAGITFDAQEAGRKFPKAVVGTAQGLSASTALHELGHLFERTALGDNAAHLKDWAAVHESSVAGDAIRRLARDADMQDRLILSDAEWFAEAFALFHRQPRRLQRVDRRAFDYLKRILAE